MNLLNVQLEQTNVNLPKFTEQAFTLKNNYYAVHDGVVYNYYPIKVLPSDDSSPLIRFEKNPPVILEGLAMIGRKIYLVTVKDLQRKVIRKSREIKYEVKDATSTDSNTSDRKSVSAILDSVESGVISDLLEPGSGDAITLEISEAADAAWEDQVGALLYDPNEEEGEWEVEDNS